MTYAIYGVNRVSKDFLYIFDDLKISFFIDDEYKEPSFLGYKVYSLDEALKKKEFDKIIVCDFDKSNKIKKLNERGLFQGDNFALEEDFFELLDEFTIPKNRKLAIWGTGTIAKEFIKYSSSLKVDYYIDSYSDKEKFNGIKVINPDEISNWKDFFIIIAIAKDSEVRERLEALGLENMHDYVSYQKIMGRPSDMLRKTIFDRSTYDLACNTMLNHLEIFYNGNTRCCCTTFVEENLDNIFEKDKDTLWHSNLHKVMCLSTENKTFSFCNKSMCPLFVAAKKKSMKIIDKPYKQMTALPEVLGIGHDSSCNLCCATCRKDLRFAKGDELKKVNDITRKIKSDYLSNAKFLILAGDGEVFASPSYKDIYTDSECNPDYIRILSNGTLFTPDKWAEFTNGKTGKIMLTVSIDAATKETYEKIRINGNFDKLKHNMEFASKLRKTGELRYFRMNFVVQEQNYREMIEFVQWGEELGVDEIFFTKILNWGTYTPEEFEKVSMMEKDGITPKKELQDVLNNPIIKNSSIVDLGTIQFSHKVDKIDIVDNYYKWELEKRGGTIFD